MPTHPGAAFPFTSLRDDAPAYWSLGIFWMVHADAAQSGGWPLIEELCGQGTGAPPHGHEWPDELFHMPGGAVTFLPGTGTRQAGARAFVAVPRGTVDEAAWHAAGRRARPPPVAGSASINEPIDGNRRESLD